MTGLVRTMPATDECGTSAWSPHYSLLLRKETQDSIKSTLTCTHRCYPVNRDREIENMFNEDFGDKTRV